MRQTHGRFGDLFTLDREKVYPDPDDSHLPLGIYSWGKGVIEYPEVKGSELSKVSYYRIPSNALLFSNIKAWEGAVAISSPWHAEKCIASQRILPFLARDREAFDVRYYFNFFLSDRGIELLGRASPGSADRNRTLNRRALDDLQVPTPTIERQRKLIDHVDDAFTVFATCRDSLGSLTAFVKKAKDEEMQRAAALGRSLTLNRVARQVKRPVQVDSLASYQMLGVRSFGRGSFNAGVLSGKDTSYAVLHKVFLNDLVYPKLMAWEGAFDVVLDSSDELHVSPEFCTFELDRELLLPEFARILVRWPGFIKSTAGSSTGTNVRRRRLQPTSLLDSNVSIPSLTEQRSIVERVNSLNRILELATERGSVAKALLRSVRNKVFDYV